MAYDSTARALYHPECAKPADMTNSGDDQRYAEISRLAYVQFEFGKEYEDIIRASLARIGFRNVAFFPAPSRPNPFDAQGFGAVDDKGNVIIAFRGTQADQFGDIRSDIRIRRRKIDKLGGIHEGFYETTESLRGDIEEWLPTDRISLVITGHSLGAAMATVLAASLKDATLVTFGSPRVGSAEFAAAFAGRAVRRYVDCLDTVARVPPAFLGFRHVAAMIYIDRKGGVHGNPLPFAARLIDGLIAFVTHPAKAWGWNRVWLRNMADHAPANYVSGVTGTR